MASNAARVCEACCSPTLASKTSPRFDALLDRTRYHVSGPNEARLLSDGWLESSSVVLPYRRHAMRAIAGAAPKGSVGATLRASVETLVIDGQRTKKDRVPISLTGLDAFPSLTRLRVERATEILSTALPFGRWLG